MADCINGGGERQFNNIDGTEPMNSSAKAPTNSRGVGLLGRACIIIYFVLLTAVAIVAFALGIYSTDKVRSLPDAVLVSNPHDSPGRGYAVYSLGSGLGYWSPASPMMFSRSDHGVIAYGRFAYLIGGLSDNNTVLKEVVQYDTETGHMEQMTNLPEPRARFAYAVLNSQIYVIGGVDLNGTQVNTVFVYDIKSNTWPVEKQSQLKAPRSDACGAAVNGKVYVFGGYNESYGTLSTVEEWDPARATGTAIPDWVQLKDSSNLQTSRGDCRAASVGNMIYAIGGNEYFQPTGVDCSDRVEGVKCYRFLNSIEAFDPTTQLWSYKAPMFNPRGDFGIEVLPGNRIIVAGGERGNGTLTRFAMYDVEEYVVDDDIWVQKAPLPQARFRDDLAYVSGRVYAFGGSPTCAVNETDCYEKALNTVYAYFDIQYPRLYAFYKQAPSTTNTNKNTGGSGSGGRRML